MAGPYRVGMRGLVSLLLAGCMVLLAACGSSAPASQSDARAGASAGASARASAGASADAGADPSAASPVTGAGTVRYVALGDSYSAAPGVPTTSLAGGCLRSDHDYPHLLAAADPRLRLTDVTCSGATTSDLSHRQRIQQVSVPPQLFAVKPSTRLVTLGIGGNDLGLFGTLLGWCLQGGQECIGGLTGRVRHDLAVIEGNLVGALRAVHRRAPRATVVLVGYPQLIPADHVGCAGLQVDPAVLAFVGRLIERFSAMMARAARAGGATYLDLIAPSAGHDICSMSPWVNGRQPTNLAIAFHPLPAEQQAVAGLLLKRVAADHVSAAR